MIILLDSRSLEVKKQDAINMWIIDMPSHARGSRSLMASKRNFSTDRGGDEVHVYRRRGGGGPRAPAGSDRGDDDLRLWWRQVTGGQWRRLKGTPRWQWRVGQV